MRHYYYELVEFITEHITGIENGNIKLWQMEQYLNAQNDVEVFVNVICVLCVTLITTSIIEKYLNKKYLNKKLTKGEA